MEALCDSTIRGTGTADRNTPEPPSIGVFRITVATTKVTASVISANSSPRSRFNGNTRAPIAQPRSAAIAAATGIVARNGQPNLTDSVAEVYMPTPRNAAWPRLK